MGQLPIVDVLIKIGALFFTLLSFVFLKKNFVKEIKIYWIFTLLIVILVFSNILIFTPGQFLTAISISVLIMLGSFISGFLNEYLFKKSLRMLVSITTILALSYLITFLILTIGVDPPHFNFLLPMGSDKIYELSILFPFSPIYSSYPLASNYHYPTIRAIGFLREPGLYQIIIITAYFMTDYVKLKYRLTTKLLLLFNLMITFSTAGYFGFLLCYFYKIFVVKEKRKNKFKNYIVIFISLIFISVLSYIFVFTTATGGYGLLDKLSSGSGNVRLIAIANSLIVFKDHPLLGIGILQTRFDFIGVSLAGTLASIGILGVTIILLPFVYISYKLFIIRDYFFIFLIPLLSTMLFSQPLFDKPITYIYLSYIYFYLHNISKNNIVYNATS